MTLGLSDAPPKLPGNLLLRIGTMSAWIALVLIVGVGIACAVPIENKRPGPDAKPTAALQARTHKTNVFVLKDGPTTVQDCGSPLMYLIRGGPQIHGKVSTDIFFDGDGTGGLKDAQAAYANAHRCRKRVANRMVPTAIVLLVGLFFGLGGLSVTVRGRARQRLAAYQQL